MEETANKERVVGGSSIKSDLLIALFTVLVGGLLLVLLLVASRL